MDIPFSSVEWTKPGEIVDGCIDEQMRLISGYKGASSTDIRKFEEAKNPKHVAISLIGEPTLYPSLPELVSEFHARGMTTFLVTNGTRPDVIERTNPSQLYVSLNAPDEETYKKVCNPMSNYWEKIKESLELLHYKDRTSIRITLIDGLNMKSPERYAKLAEIAEPDFIEIKAYMHLGSSRSRLSREAMPSHSRVKLFAENFAPCIGYEIADEVEISRVVVLSKDGRVYPLQ
jgi:tRNA wybutosine-synthesizing protein 1